MNVGGSESGRGEACPGEQKLRDFSSGKLAANDCETVAAHLNQCTACQNAMEGLSHLSDPVIGALRNLVAVDSADCRRVVEQVAGLGAEPGSRVPALVPRQIDCYEVLECLGEGGMGTVYRARHLHLEKIVALKLLTPRRTRDANAVARFQREMRAIGQLEHPNVVSARDAREVGGAHFLVMDYVDGVDLAGLVQRTGPLHLPEACELARQAACALEHIHAHSLVHRDVKPSNLMLDRGGRVKLLDLGLALLQSEAPEDALTESETTLGTVDYMAPEQADDSRAVDIRSDLYSLGCTLYYLLAGRPPFAGPDYSTAIRKLKAHSTAPVPPLRDLRSDIPSELDAIVMKLMAKDARERYQTPAEVVEALAPLAAGYDFSRLEGLRPSGEATRTRATTDMAPPLAPRRWAVAFGLIAAAFVIAGVVLLRDAHDGSAGNKIPPGADASSSQISRRQAAEQLLALGGSLVVVDQSQTHINVAHVGQLPGGPFSVERVSLVHNERVADDDLRWIVQLGDVEWLDLSFTKVSDTGLAHLEQVTSLVSLHLQRTGVSDQGLAHLTGNRELRYLWLGRTAVTDAGLAHLIEFKLLESLGLKDTSVTDAGLERLATLPNLALVNLANTRVTESGIQRFREQKPGCKIE
jgi:serine/threonine protein kinase